MDHPMSDDTTENTKNELASHIRGRKPGVQSKRKSEEELSTNKHTKRVRDRIAKLQGKEAELDRAKRADTSAISYNFLKNVQPSQAYQQASNNEKLRLKEAAKEAVIAERIRKGQHATVIASVAGVSVVRSTPITTLNISVDTLMEDDGDPDWEDIAADDDTIRLQQELDIRRPGSVPLPNEQWIESQREASAHLAQYSLVRMAFRVLRRQWQQPIKSLREKLAHLEICIDLDNCPHLPKTNDAFIRDMVVGVTTQQLPPPCQFFSRLERAVWRNLAASRSGSQVGDGWYELPGPASWWKGHDFSLHPWTPNSSRWDSRYAYHLVTSQFPGFVPKDFWRVSVHEDAFMLLAEDDRRIFAYSNAI